MEPEQSTVVNAPTPSRTIRVSHEGDYNVSVNHGVTQAENGRRFLVFSSVEDAVQAYGELKADNVRASYLTYSLFVKSQTELTEDSLRAQVLGLVPGANVTYLRVDDNSHTGKVVIDLLTDYQTMKAGSNDDLRFFHFDPKRARPRRAQDAGQTTQSNGSEWQVQQRRPRDSAPRPQSTQGGNQRPRDSGVRPQGGRGGNQRPQGSQSTQGGRGGNQRSQGQQGGRGGRGNQRPQGSRGGNNTNAV